ncbi:hypothetical protein O6R05_05770 [Peptoniphilus equinus]|uniref:Acetyltransferase, GNAT family n=1 Tax=Peptoniphilus equinus TaxID=3016343 RepID=A0ABY7QT51_9FIRM|nr:hypothetical protein [Peptoniphilus equinus]WBW49516.1 hypothetical protein O6R05_05770 [Peptoniphilus equinus]
MEYTFIRLKAREDLKERAAAWFYHKWGVPEAAYLSCEEAYIKGETDCGWYLCLAGEKIVGA